MFVLYTNNGCYTGKIKNMNTNKLKIPITDFVTKKKINCNTLNGKLLVNILVFNKVITNIINVFF